MDEDDSIKNEDYRLQAITTITNDWVSPWSGSVHKKGTPIMAVAIINFDGKQLTFGLPNMTGMFIDFAYTLWVESEHFLKEKDRFLSSKSKFDVPNSIYPNSNEQFFDLLQKRMGAIVFSYSALEAFANENIPDDYEYTSERDDKRCIEKYNKEQIERYLNLDVKLGSVLPPIMNMNSPKGKPIWNRYKQIQDLRDRIIHIKSHDRRSAPPAEKTIWGDLLSKDYPNFALEAKDIIDYFLTKTPIEKRPRWFNKFPYKI